MEELSINYIVCCFLGQRRNQMLDNPAEYAKSQIEFFKNNQDPNIKKITFVLNSDSEGQGDQFKKYLIESADECQYILERLSVYQRANVGFSYAAWDQEIRYCLDNEEEYDYYFLIEDDYVPSYSEFYKPYLNTIINKNVSYACSVVNRPEINTHPRHACSSIGMLSGKSAKDVYKNVGSIFNLNYNNDYSSGESNQIHFLDNLSFDSIEDEGYHIYFYEWSYGLIYYEKDSDLEKLPSPIKPILKAGMNHEEIIKPPYFRL